MPILAEIPENDFVVVLAAIITGAIFLIVWTVAHQWRRIRVAAYNARLKQLMIERDMSASEIERVLQAGDNADASERVQRCVDIEIGRAFKGDCCVDEKNADRGGS